MSILGFVSVVVMLVLIGGGFVVALMAAKKIAPITTDSDVVATVGGGFVQLYLVAHMVVVPLLAIAPLIK